jgi:hypothetical protein
MSQYARSSLKPTMSACARRGSMCVATAHLPLAGQTSLVTLKMHVRDGCMWCQSDFISCDSAAFDHGYLRTPVRCVGTLAESKADQRRWQCVATHGHNEPGCDTANVLTGHCARAYRSSSDTVATKDGSGSGSGSPSVPVDLSPASPTSPSS